MTAPTPEELAAIEARLAVVETTLPEDLKRADLRALAEDVRPLLAEVRRLMAQLRPLRQIIDLTAEARAGVDDHPQAERAAAPPVGQTVEQAIEHIIREVAELPNRTSPDNWPEAMLVTDDELASILRDTIISRDAEVARAAEAKILRDVASALQKTAPEIAAKLVEGWRVATGEELLEVLRAPAPAEKKRTVCRHDWVNHRDGTGHCTKCSARCDGNGILP